MSEVKAKEVTPVTEATTPVKKGKGKIAGIISAIIAIVVAGGFTINFHVNDKGIDTEITVITEGKDNLSTDTTVVKKSAKDGGEKVKPTKEAGKNGGEKVKPVIEKEVGKDGGEKVKPDTVGKQPGVTPKAKVVTKTAA